MPSSPERRSRGGPGAPALAAVLAAGALLALPRPGGAYLDGAPPGHTGGFGEPTCHACHRDLPVGEPPGSLGLVVPAPYVPGAEHVVEIRLRRPDLARAGFQLAVRHAAGEAAGGQAGHLAPSGPDTAVSEAGGVLYLGHATAGTRAEGGVAVWRVRWTAPAGDAAGPVIFHAAANAGNDDESELGDAVYAAARVVEPEPAGGAVSGRAACPSQRPGPVTGVGRWARPGRGPRGARR